MDKVVVTVVCSVALAGAFAISLRWGGLDTSGRPDQRISVKQALRRLCVLEVSGLVAGVLVGGFGSRLMMRIMAATSPAAAQGRVTEAGETVGRVTTGGTIGLLIFVGVLFGLLGAVVYVLVRRFLPRRSWLAGIVLGLLALGVFARSDPLSPRNRDFEILSPVILAVILIVVLFLLYGTTVVALATRLDRDYPALELKPRSLIAYVPLLLLALPPLPLFVVAAILIGAVGPRVPALGRVWRSDAVRTAGRVVVALVAIAGNVWLALGVADILS